jgi:hypothetical protein
MTLDASGNLALGKTSASYRADVQGNFRFENTASGSLNGYFGASDTGSITLNFGGTTTPAKGRIFYSDNSDLFAFYTNSTERARIDSSGNLLVGTTSYSGVQIGVGYAGNVNTGIGLNDTTSTSGCGFMAFQIGGTTIGSISRVAATSAVVYNTTSDYRLKTVTGAVTGQGSRIDALKPIDYLWTDGGQQARGFLAHEFQTVYPNSVTGEKDAIDANGNPKYQSMQAATSEVIADLVAEIQSLRQRLSAANL